MIDDAVTAAGADGGTVERRSSAGDGTAWSGTGTGTVVCIGWSGWMDGDVRDVGVDSDECDMAARDGSGIELLRLIT